MRHRKKTVKLGRTSEHRASMLANLVCDLVTNQRITTTLPKAKAARVLAEKMVTLGKRGNLAARRVAISRIRRSEVVAKLFSDVAPAMKDRQGGYTRIYKLGNRSSDGAERAILEWVTYVPPQPPPKEEEGKKGKAAKSKKAAEAAAAEPAEAKKD